MGAVAKFFCTEPNMKQFVVLCLFATVFARPGSYSKGDEFDFLISSCLYENWDLEKSSEENMNNVFACLKCFDEIVDPMTEVGIPEARACTETFLPEENAACSSQIAGLEPGNVETGTKVAECFEEWAIFAAADYCISESKSTEPIEILTDGSMCMLEGYKNVTMFTHYVHSLDEKRSGKKIRKLQKTRKGEKGVRKYVMKKLLPLAACEVANAEDESRFESCKECFATVTKQNHATVGRQCMSDYLMPYFQECEQLMDSLEKGSSKEDKQEVKKCFGRGLIKHVVGSCSEPETGADPETLLATMECGQEYVIDWVQSNARPEFSKKIVQFLSFDEEDDEDNEDDFEN